MIDVNVIRAQPELFRAAIRRKRIDLDLDKLLAADSLRRDLQFNVDALRKEKNLLSARIKRTYVRDFQKDRGISFSDRNALDAAVERNLLLDESRAVDQKLSELEPQLRRSEQEFHQLMLLVPSLPADDVPDGESDDDNIELRRWGTPREFDFLPKDHLEIARALNLAVFAQAHSIAGSRSCALIGDGALLEMAVLRFALDFVVSRGFVAVVPPVMVTEQAMIGTGYFPIGRENAYAIERDNLYLTGTSEVALVALQANETLTAADLPRRYVGVSTCFRREAGAAGKDTKGLYRVHQFQKVEQVVFTENDQLKVEEEHLFLLSNAELILQALELPYRVVTVCAGELAVGQVRKHDIETWMPSRKAYGETHSCSTLGDFQARRLNIRYVTTTRKKAYVHTLNNTALASPRILIALLENHQRADGSVYVPAALRPYLGGRDCLVPLAEMPIGKDPAS